MITEPKPSDNAPLDVERQAAAERNATTLVEKLTVASVPVEIHVGILPLVPADAVVVSANNWLYLGSGSAGEVEQYAGRYPEAVSASVLAQMSSEVFPHMPFDRGQLYAENSNGFSKLQLACLQLLQERPFDKQTALFSPYPLGTVIQTDSFDIGASRGAPKMVFHAVAMGYFVLVRDGELELVKIPTTVGSVIHVVRKVLTKAAQQGMQAITLPLFGTNSGGLKIEQSVEALAKAIIHSSRSHLQKTGQEKMLTVKLVLPKKQRYAVDTAIDILDSEFKKSKS